LASFHPLLASWQLANGTTALLTPSANFYPWGIGDTGG